MVKGWRGSTEHGEEVSWIINEAEMTVESVVSQDHRYLCNTQRRAKDVQITVPKRAIESSQL